MGKVTYNTKTKIPALCGDGINTKMIWKEDVRWKNIWNSMTSVEGYTRTYSTTIS